MSPVLQADFWENRYQDGSDRWDLGQPAPPFVSLLSAETAPPTGSLVALGMGRGHDALLFAQHGFDVTGVDFAPSAIAHARQQATAQGLSFQAFQRDIFDLVPDYAGTFDYVLEHTCFCAIAPSQRQPYIHLVHQLLKPTGTFIGLFWAHSREGGPPYGTTPAKLHDLFSPRFDTASLTPVKNSVPNRADEELLALFHPLSVSSS
ncbi:MAG: methyltransferase domain-containing protein [Kaiparowitsia implicata GSE-PSE-MK54-09C]|jgi:SAM-dependent methyltransferase|nr:methyltransferase domain-containing protein [Kaiparowitsia implicata GSE-PSE-MK54-09C]